MSISLVRTYRKDVASRQSSVCQDGHLDWLIICIAKILMSDRKFETDEFSSTGDARRIYVAVPCTTNETSMPSASKRGWTRQLRHSWIFGSDVSPELQYFSSLILSSSGASNCRQLCTFLMRFGNFRSKIGKSSTFTIQWKSQKDSVNVHWPLNHVVGIFIVSVKFSYTRQFLETSRNFQT